eukprot:SAG11_NODE_98_length_16927_cov_35.166211_3_plen_123_part_00
MRSNGQPSVGVVTTELAAAGGGGGYGPESPLNGYATLQKFSTSSDRIDDRAAAGGIAAGDERAGGSIHRVGVPASGGGHDKSHITLGAQASAGGAASGVVGYSGGAASTIFKSEHRGSIGED